VTAGLPVKATASLVFTADDVKHCVPADTPGEALAMSDPCKGGPPSPLLTVRWAYAVGPSGVTRDVTARGVSPSAVAYLPPQA
jgi:hypothetical protein